MTEDNRINTQKIHLNYLIPFTLISKIFKLLFNVLTYLIEELFSSTLIGVLIHFLILVMMVLWKLKIVDVIEKNPLSFNLIPIIIKQLFNIPSLLKNTFIVFDISRLLHKHKSIRLVYTSLFCHIIITANSMMINNCIPHSGDTFIMYYTLAINFLSEATITAVSYPYTLAIKNMFAFSILYICKSNSWILGILSRQHSDVKLVFYGILQVGIVATILKVTLKKIDIHFLTATGLLSFEHLISLFYTARVVIMLIMNINESNTVCKTFILEMAYYLLRILLITYYAKSLSRFRLPVTYFKMVIMDLYKIRKKIISFYQYYKVYAVLLEIPDSTFEGNTTCAICADDMVVGKKLSCNHSYHLECLRSWITRESTCPICRAKLI